MICDLIHFANIFAGFAVLFCYINNVTFYAACIAINERRVANNRHFLFCNRVKPKEDLVDEGKSTLNVFCCAGGPPTNREEAESFLDKLPRWLFPKVVLKLPIKIFIILLFAGYLAVGIYGSLNLKQGLRFTQLVAEDSYFYKYALLIEEEFPRQVPLSLVITDNYQYSDPKTKVSLDALIVGAKANEYVDSDFEANWLKTYTNSRYYNGSDERSFISELKRFLNDTQYDTFQNDVVINELGTKITASRIHLLSRDLEGSQEEGQLMIELREIVDTADIESFAYSPLFVLAEQYISILSQSLQNVGISLAAVFVITCIFMPHPVLIIFVSIAVTMIMVGVFGYMYFVDIALSAITMIHLILSVGFSIDFTAHICHGCMISNGKTRHARVKQAIDKTGAPVFHGAVSSMIGIIPLAAAQSYVFRAFATVMAFVLFFGVVHALLLLPVLLSWLGPGRLQITEKTVDKEINGVDSHGATISDGIKKNGFKGKVNNGYLSAGDEVKDDSNNIFHLNQCPKTTWIEWSQMN